MNKNPQTMSAADALGLMHLKHAQAAHLTKAFDELLATAAQSPTQQTIETLARMTAQAIDKAVYMAFERKTGESFDKASDTERLSKDDTLHGATFYLDGEPLVRISLLVGSSEEAAMDELSGRFMYGPRVVATYLAGEPDDVPY